MTHLVWCTTTPALRKNENSLHSFNHKTGIWLSITGNGHSISISRVNPFYQQSSSLLLLITLTQFFIFSKIKYQISPNFHVFLKMKSYSLTCSLTCIQNTGCWCSITSSGFTKLVIILPLFLCLTFMPICHAEVPFLPYLNISFICVSLLYWIQPNF